MKTEARDESDEHISKRGSREHVCQIRPRECGHVTGEECQERQDSEGDPGVQNDEEQTGNVVQGNTAGVFHAAGQQGITRSAE